MWEEVVCASLWISVEFQWIWVDFLHVDLRLYLYYLQSIYRRQVLTAKPSLYFSSQSLRLSFSLAIFKVYSLIRRPGGEAKVGGGVGEGGAVGGEGRRPIEGCFV